MNRLICLLLSCLIFQQISALEKDSTVTFKLPDSLKAISFMAEINVQFINSPKEQFGGIKTDLVKLSLETEKNKKAIVFAFPATASILSKGLQVDDSEKGELEWEYNWSLNENYKLLIMIAQDSAENYVLNSGYFWLPKEKKWKLIGTCKLKGNGNQFNIPVFFSLTLKKAIAD